MYGDNRYRPQQGTPPVREGEEFDVKIESVGEKGDGIARKDGFVLFVPGTKRGDEVRIRVTRVLPKLGFAEKIGQVAQPAKQERPQKEPEPEFDPEEHLDSEDFGDSEESALDEAGAVAEEVSEELDEPADAPEESVEVLRK